jgi:Tfp pilus assembly protein PilN
VKNIFTFGSTLEIMMNINLNLLSSEKKNRIEYILKIFLVKDIVELFLLMVAILSATLVWSWVFLQNDFAKLSASAVSVNQSFYSDNKETKNVNNLLKEIGVATKNFSPLTPKLRDLISSLPSDVKLQSLRLDNSSQTITLNGTAQSRASLLSFQENLNKIPWLTNLETPVSQLFQKQNIDFEFKAKLKQEKDAKKI